MTIIRMREPDTELVSSPPPTAGTEVADGHSSPTVAAAAALVGVGSGASSSLAAPSTLSRLDPSLRPNPTEPGGHGHQRRTTTMGSLGLGLGGEANFWDLGEVLRKKHDLFEGLTPPGGGVSSAGGTDWALGGSGTSGGGGGTYSSLGFDRPASAMGGLGGLGGFNAFDATSNGSTTGAWNEIALPKDWSALSLLPTTFLSPFSPNLAPANAAGANAVGAGSSSTSAGGGPSGAGGAGGYGGLESWFTSSWLS